MSSEVFHRPTRHAGPSVRADEIVLDPLPQLPESAGGGRALLTSLPMLAGAGSTVLLVGGSGGSPMTYLASGLMGLSMIGMAAGGLGRSAGERRRRADGDRRDYLQRLARVRERVRHAAREQRAAGNWAHPDPGMLWCVAAGSRLWERRRDDDDYLVCRVGRGTQRSAVRLVLPEVASDARAEPVTARAVQRFARAHARVRDVPVTVPLAALDRVAVAGALPRARGLVRAMLAQLITFHPPGDLVVAVCCAAELAGSWDWLKWVPHTSAPTRDAAGGRSDVLLAHDPAVLQRALAAGCGREPGWVGLAPHIVVVVDGVSWPFADAASRTGQRTTVLELGRRDAGSDGVQVHVDDGGVLTPSTEPGGADQPAWDACSDGLGLVAAESLARQVSGLRLPTDAAQPGTARTFADLLALPSALTGDDAAARPPRSAPPHPLRTPIGTGADGLTVELDLKEAAQGGSGPHGLVVGATGSGKSELLRTLVVGLALTHSSDTLNFVLVDFKGGATFARFDRLPHTAAVITNLESELALVDRMRDAVEGELIRRQQALRAAGNHASLRDYDQARRDGAALPPLPSLLVVVDEFSELLAARPDFVDLFVAIGRVGRSLGVHLLLASQRLDEGRLRGLETHLSYRIGLRTFSAAESRAVLGVPDAHALPNEPGHAYLKQATGELVQFRADYVSGATARPPAADTRTVTEAVVPFGVGLANPKPRTADLPESGAQRSTTCGETLLDSLLDRLASDEPAARPIWLPPLGAPPTVGELLERQPSGGTPAVGHGHGFLAAAVGLVDRPREQRRDPLRVELAGSHFVVVGRPQSGKSTLLRSLILALALTHGPTRAQFYCLDFGGGTLTGLADLPHVGAVARRADRDLIRRTIADLTALLGAREELFAQHGVDGMATFRRRLAAGDVPSDGYGDVCLVVDGWNSVRHDDEELESAITAIAARGLGYGVHVVLSAQRWTDLRPALRDLMGQRLELRLGDPSESEIDRRAARHVPENRPGRGLSPDGSQFLAALPRVDGVQSVDNLVPATSAAVDRVRRGSVDAHAPAVRLLPDDLRYDGLPARPPGEATLPIGIDEDTLTSACVDLASEPHFLVIGDVGSGKSNLLRVIARGIQARWSPSDVRVIVFDYRRGLAGAVASPYRVAHAANAGATPAVLAGIVTALQQRLATLPAGHDAVTPSPTWTGSRLVLLLDDYELISGRQGGPLHPLAEFVPHARDIGLHIVLARASAGAGQAMFDPVLRGLRDMGTPGVLLSGGRDEGAILGRTRMEPLPTGRGRLVHRKHGAVLIQTARC